jgi:hypothetical protein
LAVLAVAYVVYVGSSPMSSILSSSCGVEGALPFGRVAGSEWCDESVIHVRGVWPLLWLGLLLAGPLALAARALHRAVSWTAVAVFTGLAFIGLANWSNFWGVLLIGFPLAVIALIVAGVQHVVSEHA